MDRRQHTKAAIVVSVALLVSVAIAETKKELRYTVGPNANVSVDTQYGAISVKPGTTGEVVIRATSQSDNTQIDSQQRGNRVDVTSRVSPTADAQSGRVDYEILVPADASVSLRSSTGPLSAEHLQGDLSLEGTDAVVDIHDVSNGHVHVTTMHGPVTLTDVSNGHVEISSISGNVTLKSVSGPLVLANSGSGRIYYAGDFGSGGDYRLTTHKGDIEVFVPADVSADFSAHSMLGKVENDFKLQPHQYHPFEQGRAFFGSVGKATSAVVLRSFSGRIRLKQQTAFK